MTDKRDKGGWCGDTHGSTNHWIEVDFTQGAGIRGLVIQKPQDGHGEYVQTISIQFMLFGSSEWQYLSSAGPSQPQVSDEQITKQTNNTKLL